MEIRKHLKVMLSLVSIGMILLITLTSCGEPKATKVEVTPEAATVMVNETVDFKAKAVTDDGETVPDVTIEWRVKGDAGTIKGDGQFTATSPGEVEIIAQAGELSGRSKVTVNPEPQVLGKVTVEPTEKTLIIGEAFSLKGTALSTKDEPMPDQKIAWSVKGEGASVDESGAFTAEKPGTFEITAKAGDFTAQSAVTVEPKTVASLEVDLEKDKALPGSKLKISVKALADGDEPAGYNTVSITSPTEGTAPDETSLVLGADGLAEVVVTLAPAPVMNKVVFKSGEITKDVEIEGTRFTKIAIQPGAGPFQAGRKVDFKAIGQDDYGNEAPVEVSWSITGDNTTLSEGGQVLMNQPGKSIIIAKYEDITQAQAISVVTGEPAEIKLSPEKADLRAGESQYFVAESFNEYGYPLTTEIKWNVEGQMGTVSDSGTFTAQTEGEGRVTAMAGEASAQAPVTVKPGPLAELVITLPQTTITAGETIAIDAQGVDAYGNQFPVEPRWFLSKSLGIISQEDKTFTAQYSGTGEIRAVVENIMKTQEIKVLPSDLIRLEMSPQTVDLIAGEPVQFEVAGYDKFSNLVDIQPKFSLKENLGDLLDTGEFTAKTAGNTTVVVQAGGLSAESSVSIEPAEMKTAKIEPPGEVRLRAGISQLFNAYGFDEFGNVVKADIVWEVFPELGEMNEQGNFFPKKAGKGAITATVKQGYTGKVLSPEVSISIDPGDTALIKLEPTDLTITAGEKKEFSATPYDGQGNETGARVQWKLLNSELGLISDEGSFTARRAGDSEIQANVGKVVASAKLKVVPAEIVLLKVIPESVSLKAGEEIRMDVVGEDRFGNFTKQDIIWDVSDTAVGEISDQGVLTAKKEGRAIVMAASRNLVNQVSLTVEKSDLAKIEITPAAHTVQAGQTVLFGAKGYDAGGNELEITPQWTVDKDLGQINDQGAFQAVTVGQCQVSAASGNITGTAQIAIDPGAAADITIDPQEITIVAGLTQEFSVEIKDKQGNLIENVEYGWELTSNLGNTLSANSFQAVKSGQGELKVSYDQVETAVPVTVNVGALATITVDPDSVRTTAGQTTQFAAKGYDAYGNEVEIVPNWTVTKGMGAISEAGEFQALKTNEGYVAANVEQVVGAAPVIIEPGPAAGIEIQPAQPKVVAGESIVFSATAFDANGNVTPAEFSWSLSEDKLGSLTAEGEFSAKAVGQGAIVAQADGVKGQTEIQVTPGPLDKIEVTLEKDVVTAGEQIQVNYKGLDEFENEKPIEPVFSVTPDTLGRMLEGDRFEASKAGKGEIKVSLDQVETTASIEVKPGEPARIEIKKPDEEFKAGKDYNFEAIGYDVAGNEVPIEARWAVTPSIGQIELNQGAFHAQKAGDGLIIVYANGIKTWMEISVKPGDLYSLFVLPNSVTVKSGSLQEFTLEGLDVEENEVQVSTSTAEWIVVGGIGEVKSPGVFQATKMGKGKITAYIGDLLAQSYITVEPGGPNVQNSRIRVTHPLLPADGESFSEIIVEVLDEHNNPVPDIQVKVISSRRTDTVVQPPKTDVNGQARGRIQSKEPGSSIISALWNDTVFQDTASLEFK